jgi:hypothetical protein
LSGNNKKYLTPIEAARKAEVYHPEDSAKLIRRMIAIKNANPTHKNDMLVKWAFKVHRGVKQLEAQCKVG